MSSFLAGWQLLRAGCRRRSSTGTSTLLWTLTRLRLLLFRTAELASSSASRDAKSLPRTQAQARVARKDTLVAPGTRRWPAERGAPRLAHTRSRFSRKQPTRTGDCYWLGAQRSTINCGNAAPSLLEASSSPCHPWRHRRRSALHCCISLSILRWSLP